MLTITIDQIKKMTDSEVVAAFREDSLLATIRTIFASEAATIDQATQQRKPPSIIEIRRMELIAAAKILEEVDRTWNGQE